MSAELPDDVSQWPTDPYALLNVPAGVDAVELKRAYTRLIRRFKPEQHPEQFRRIREAYDSILHYVQFYERFRSTLDVDGAVAPGSIAPETCADAPSAPPDLVSAAWEVAIQGDEAAAYHRLQELHAQLPGSDAAVRLYWLLTLYPDCAATLDPIHWLVAALKRSQLGGPARELFRRELLDRPHAALHEEISQLWSVAAAPERIAELADWRWQAAALLQVWSVIEDDLKQLREPLSHASELVWVQLLATAADLLAWVESWNANTTWSDVIQEIAALDHVARDHPYIFDRLDYLQIIALDWRKWELLPFAEFELMPLVAMAWTRPVDEVRPHLLQFADKIREDPLHWFDKIQPAATGPTALSFLADQMRTYEDDGNGVNTPLPNHSDLRAFLGKQFWQHYWTYHRALLQFCLTHQIEPTAIAAVATADLAFEANELSPLQLVRSDGAINLVYHAVHRLQG